MTTLTTRLSQATEPTRELLEDARPAPPVCADFDEDCADVPDKVHCFLYDPAKGACPYLRDPAIACLKARGL